MQRHDLSNKIKNKANSNKVIDNKGKIAAIGSVYDSNNLQDLPIKYISKYNVYWKFNSIQEKLS